MEGRLTGPAACAGSRQEQERTGAESRGHGQEVKRQCKRQEASAACALHLKAFARETAAASLCASATPPNEVEDAPLGLPSVWRGRRLKAGRLQGSPSPTCFAPERLADMLGRCEACGHAPRTWTQPDTLPEREKREKRARARQSLITCRAGFEKGQEGADQKAPWTGSDRRKQCPVPGAARGV